MDTISTPPYTELFSAQAITHAKIERQALIREEMQQIEMEEIDNGSEAE